MMYPIIYSLSTVGIIKHYNHDYLFHEKRTDFIGPNGVGKSILADLLQVLFIYDKELIKFGTEDVKETRYIHTLPHETTCAYCFLNIMVQQDKFITIGVQIHSQDRKRLVPFVITKSTELNSDLSQLTMDKDEVLFSKNFIKNNTIPDIEDLAEWLNDERRLKLIFFKNREEVQGYYNFLSSKDLLPINLSKENNLKAFAKVIQSFSKAKTLKLSGKDASKNLKEFLLEETEDDIRADFEKKKLELEKVLKDYKRLDEHTKQLSKKQKYLDVIDLQYQSYTKLLTEYRGAEISNCMLELDIQKRAETEGHLKLEQRNKDFKKLQILINKIPRLESEIQNRHKAAEENYEQAYRYKQLIENIEALNDQINELTMLVLPEIDHSWKTSFDKVDMSLRTVAEIKRYISFSLPYLEKYSTLENIEKKREQELIELDRLKIKLISEQKQKKKLLNMLRNHEEGSVLYWYIKNLPPLSIDAMQAVLYFATLSTTEVPSPKNSDRYINTEELVNLQINKTKEGIWIKLGTLSEFITYNPDAELLISNSGFNLRVQQLIDKLGTELIVIEKKLSALDNIRDGLDYDRNLFQHIFSPEVCDASKIRQLETAVRCILQIDEKLATLQVEKIHNEEELQNLKKQFSLEYDEPEVIERTLKDIKNHWLGRITKISKYSGKKEGELKSLEKDIETINKDLETITRNILTRQQELEQLNIDYYTDFNENILQFNTEEKQLSALKEKSDKAYDIYKRKYIEAVSEFEETKGEKNSEINYELHKNTYSFRVLERALLGANLKTRDEIVPALQDANNERTRIADGIRDRMVEIFSKTTKAYNIYKSQVQTISAFFVNRKRISDKYLFNVEFKPNLTIKIEDIEKMAYDIRYAAISGELAFSDQSVTDFLEDFFKKLAGLNEKIPIAQLLDPKTYFHINANLEDEFGNDVSGSTGESYSAIALLAVARLSTQKDKPKGIRFIILEELGSLDDTNFNIFPEIAEEFHYQIITMAPRTFNIGLSDEWYAHHLIKGKFSDKINYYPSSSYFKTRDFKEQLNIYLNNITE
ncbi:hypothetical protein [Pedobacter terrae]|uniref:hypothetical protein n=1 Tax=Pedobacter terrae TaxID=405671 RepID=UPI002FF6A777